MTTVFRVSHKKPFANDCLRNGTSFVELKYLLMEAEIVEEVSQQALEPGLQLLLIKISHLFMTDTCTTN